MNIATKYVNNGWNCSALDHVKYTTKLNIQNYLFLVLQYPILFLKSCIQST